MNVPPRVVVRDYLIDKLKTITTGNGYSMDVELVELRSRLTRDLNDSDCPAILITLGRDTRRTETLGGNVGNRHFRVWAMDLELTLRDAMSQGETVTDAGESFLRDVQRCLILNRGNGNGSGMPSDITFEIASSEFTRVRDDFAQYTLGISVLFDFKLADL